MATKTTAKSRAKTSSATRKKPVAKKTVRTTKATKQTSLSQADRLVIIWVGLILVFLLVVVKAYVIG